MNEIKWLLGVVVDVVVQFDRDERGRFISEIQYEPRRQRLAQRRFRHERHRRPCPSRPWSWVALPRGCSPSWPTRHWPARRCTWPACCSWCSTRRTRGRRRTSIAHYWQLYADDARARSSAPMAVSGLGLLPSALFIAARPSRAAWRCEIRQHDRDHPRGADRPHCAAEGRPS